MSRPARIALALLSSVLTVAASYGLALAGEPTSWWLWADVLGLI